ncbi:HAD family hydrolase [Leptolyngbya sp. PCC 6406]|uniref:HAD family hydrolase n=1 Tax=Leptolyngbya sp. PCC 6406 TaxID=1173264 RepID=UPI0002ACD495|nr:HAD family hydrolase [Leptolyngbya sp. PCC 6406]
MARVQCGDHVLESVAGIVFDKDGTLADSLPFLFTLAQMRSRLIDQTVPGLYPDLLAAWGAAQETLRPDGLMAVGTRPDNEIAAAAYVAARGRGWAEARELVHQAFIAADALGIPKAAATPPFPGIAELLASLHRAGIRLAVLSGDSTPNVQDFLAHHGLTPLVAWGQGSDRTLAKPDPILLHQACDRIQVPVSQTWVVGDSALDIQLARQGGAAGSISVTWGGSPPLTAADIVVTQVDQITVLP